MLGIPEANPVDSYLEAVGSATSSEIISEVRGCPEDVYARLAALESAGKAILRVYWSGKRVHQRVWEWTE